MAESTPDLAPRLSYFQGFMNRIWGVGSSSAKGSGEGIGAPLLGVGGGDATWAPTPERPTTEPQEEEMSTANGLLRQVMIDLGPGAALRTCGGLIMG